MTISTSKVGDAFHKGLIAKGSSVTSTGDKLYSYGTVILQRLPNGRIVGNITKYSPTTSRHQSQTGVHNVLLLGNQHTKRYY